MGVINPGNTLEFKSIDSLFARVRKRLKSYDAAGILDEGDWFFYVREVVDKLGVSVYDEREAVTMVTNFKACLPDDFSTLYAAYKCSPNIVEGKQTVFPQTGFVYYIEETHEHYNNCGTGACATKQFDGDKITIRSYLEGQPTTIKLDSPTLLRLSGNAKGICDDKCANLFAKTAHEITISRGFIYTNFNNDSIFLKYYALALDRETGLPMIPDNTFIEKAIEDYIVYRIFEDFFFNGEVPDIQNKYQLARANYEDSLKQALYWCKLPSFQAAVNKVRLDRKNLRIYQQLG